MPYDDCLSKLAVHKEWVLLGDAEWSLEHPVIKVDDAQSELKLLNFFEEDVSDATFAVLDETHKSTSTWPFASHNAPSVKLTSTSFDESFMFATRELVNTIDLYKEGDDATISFVGTLLPKHMVFEKRKKMRRPSWVTDAKKSKTIKKNWKSAAAEAATR